MQGKSFTLRCRVSDCTILCIKNVELGTNINIMTHLEDHMFSKSSLALLIVLSSINQVLAQWPPQDKTHPIPSNISFCSGKPPYDPNVVAPKYMVHANIPPCPYCKSDTLLINGTQNTLCLTVTKDQAAKIKNIYCNVGQDRDGPYWCPVLPSAGSHGSNCGMDDYTFTNAYLGSSNDPNLINICSTFYNIQRNNWRYYYFYVWDN